MCSVGMAIFLETQCYSEILREKVYNIYSITAFYGVKYKIGKKV